MRCLLMLLMFSLLSFNTSFAQADQVTCDSVGVASCLTEDGMCVEFFEGGNSDVEIWENLCMSMDGEFSETSACDKGKMVMSCLNESNPMMVMTRFTADFDGEMAQMMCTSMGGTICPKKEL